MGFLCGVFGHRWQGCQCARCGQQRDTGHLFELEEGQCRQSCSLCGKTEDVPCTWHHCACTHCGKTRDLNHDWINTSQCEQVCRICGKERGTHRYEPAERGVDRCKRCGRLRRLTAEEIAERDEQWSEAFPEDTSC